MTKALSWGEPDKKDTEKTRTNPWAKLKLAQAVLPFPANHQKHKGKVLKGGESKGGQEVPRQKSTLGNHGGGRRRMRGGTSIGGCLTFRIGGK